MARRSILEAMGVGKIGFLCVCVVLLSILMVRDAGGRQRGKGLFLGLRDTSVAASSELNEALVSGYSNIEDLICNPFSRRHLADQPLRALPPASAPTLGSSPMSAPFSSATIKAPTSGPAPSPHPGVGTPRFGPAPSSNPAPASSPAPENQSSANSHNLTPGSAPVLPSKKSDNNERIIIIAVFLTAAGTSFMAACLFCCYRKCCRDITGSINGQRDERPLLSLGLSDFSGWSPKSFGKDTSTQKDKIGGLSLKTDPGQNNHVLSSDISSDGTQTSDIRSGNSSSSTEMSIISSNDFEPGPPPPPPVMLPTIKKVAPSPLASAPPAPPPPPPVMSPIRKVGLAPPAPPPPLPNSEPGPQPPPPPKGALPSRLPHGGLISRVTQPSSIGSNRSGDAASAQHFGAEDDANAPTQKTKLKPFFWDKVRANPDQSMVWDQIRSGSFQFSEEMIQTLFGYNYASRNKSEGKESSSNVPPPGCVQLIDPKKSQNLAISLKALNVKTEEVCHALMEGKKLPVELLITLLRMSPTADEEMKLKVYGGNLSQLGPAEQFLKVVVDIPFAFKRMDALLFMASLQEDVLVIKESFATLEVACTELRSSRLFLKLLEAVLKMGNRMNDGTFRGGARAFKLDTLLKLSDVKGTDGKTTLLHFVVQEIIRSEGVRAARLASESGSTSSLARLGLNSDEDSPRESGDYYCDLGLKVISGLSSELENVKKAAGLDGDVLTNMVASCCHRLSKTKEFLNNDMRNLDEDGGFYHSLKCFIEHAETDIAFLTEEEKRIKSLVKSTTNYFHGDAGKDEGLRLFVIVRDFLGMLDKACKEVRKSPLKTIKTPKTRGKSSMANVPDLRQLLFPAIRDRRVEDSSSDEES